MPQNIIVSGPALSISGYGRQTRFALKSLREHTNHNIFINPREWGNTPWTFEETEETEWIQERVQETAEYIQQQGQFDLSVQVCIPNELEPMAPTNICYTAGIEVDEVAPQWIQKCNEVADKVIVVSKFAKEIFDNTSYDLENEVGQVVRPNFEMNVPVDYVHFPYREAEEVIDLNLDTKYDYNFLSVAQWCPRKNVESLVRWFVEEFYDRKVGLILKANQSNNSLADYRKVKGALEQILEGYEDRKCAVQLLHGGLKEEEILSLYHQDEVKTYISTTHGECFGLPLFEAACSGTPVIAPDWSGHTDYLYQDDEPLFSNIPVDMKPIEEEAQWEGVLRPGTNWAYPRQGPFKMAMREAYKKYPKHVSRSKKLKKKLKERHSDQHEEFVEKIDEFLSSGEEYYSLEDLDIEEI